MYPCNHSGYYCLHRLKTRKLPVGGDYLHRQAVVPMAVASYNVVFLPYIGSSCKRVLVAHYGAEHLHD